MAIYLKSPGITPQLLLVRSMLKISWATGWLVTLGFFNSITESLPSGVPL